MKKLFLCILALALAISPFTVNASALDTDQDIKVYYYAGSKASEVVSVDIAWGAMEFSYYDEVEGTWNPSTHQFDNSSPARWEILNNSNYVTITNHSNKDITATLALYMNPGYSSVTAQFDTTTLTIPTAVGTASNNSPSSTAYLTLSGELDIESLDQTAVNAVSAQGHHVVGTIIVTING